MSLSPKIHSPQALRRIASSALLIEEYNAVSGHHYILVDASSVQRPLLLTQLPNCPVIALCSDTVNNTAVLERSDFDCFVYPSELEQLLANINAQPHAATVLCQLLRQSLSININQALINESFAYSLLQSSAGFRQWLRQRPKPSNDEGQSPTVVTSRANDILEIVLDRPLRHNAYNAAMRDELWAALQLAVTDVSIEQTILSGNGPSFCAGGDLTEFGAVTDAAIAHIARTTRSPSRLLSQLTSNVTVEVHGACIGAGIELPAFCHHIRAHGDAYFKLPEVAFGLIPGAGGTVSISRRIGRQATARLALLGNAIDAELALQIGLIDAII